MTEISYNHRRRLLSAARDLMSDIDRHTKGLQTALSFVNSEKSESFHADEIVDDTIMLEMLLEDFKGDIPEEFEPFQREVTQRKKMYGDLFGDQWYENKRTYLEEELAEATYEKRSKKIYSKIYQKRKAGRAKNSCAYRQNYSVLFF